MLGLPSGSPQIFRKTYPQIFRNHQTRPHHGREAPVDVATVTADVFDDGRALGPMSFMVDHAPHREANQGNVTTVLAWGARMGAYLRQRDRRNWYVIIERRANGTFELRLQRQAP
jgi:hypothetical protein